MQHYWWKASELQAEEIKIESIKVVELSQLQRDRISSLKSLFLKDQHQAEKVFSSVACESKQEFFDWAGFAASLSMLEDYVFRLRKELMMSLHYWKEQESIFNIAFDAK